MKSICINVLLQNATDCTATNIADFRDYVISKIPTAKFTWCPDNNFCFPGNKNAENELIATYLAMGDDLAMGDGFPAVDHTTLGAFQSSVDEFWTTCFGRYGKTPTVATAWHYPATYLAYLVSKGVKIATGTVWSQTGVDRFQGEGSKLFPYYPSTTNSFVPGKTPATTQNIVLCNSLSPDPLGCRTLAGTDSRWTLHPADPEPANANSQKWILDQALLQDDYPLFVYPEISWLYTSGATLSDNWKRFIDYLATKSIEIKTMTEYNEYFRAKFPNNFHENGMVFTGSGITKGIVTSSANLKQYWFEDHECSVCLQENLTTHAITCEACISYVNGIPESYGKFNFQGTLYSDYSYKIGKSYKYDQYSTYYAKEIAQFVSRAKVYFKLS